MPVERVDDDSTLEGLLSSSEASRLVVCDFTASWCGPCRAISPFVDSLAIRFPRVRFVKIDVDTCANTARRHSIRAMPTFVFFRAAREIDRMEGANSSLLQSKVEALASDEIAQSGETRATAEERAFLSRFVPYSEQVMQYENEVARIQALSVIPVELVEMRGDGDSVDEPKLLKDLLAWFKSSFFKWVDAPNCDRCHHSTQAARGDCPPTDAEREAGASKVELYNCTNCNALVRFARFNNPTTLLETRKGRCGEWANCFTLCARAVGFDARFVVDVSDHVWTEVFIAKWDRWVHCDPCENVMDRPLLYEKGWGKKLSYVFAFAHDHMADVTWRYSSHYKEILKRRDRCRETVLINFIRKMNLRKESRMREDRKRELMQRQMKELVEFLTPRLQTRSTGDEQGRTSGDIAWRKARHELGEQRGANKRGVVVVPDQEELNAGHMLFVYKCGKDIYERPTTGRVTKGWATMTNSWRDVQRKEEHDWKKCYLSRDENAQSGEIVWRFVPGRAVAQFDLRLGGIAMYENGRVEAVLCSGDVCTLVRPDSGTARLQNLDSSCEVTLTVTFNGGRGDVAWQHAQLCRTDLDSDEVTLSVSIRFA